MAGQSKQEMEQYVPCIKQENEDSIGKGPINNECGDKRVIGAEDWIACEACGELVENNIKLPQERICKFCKAANEESLARLHGVSPCFVRLTRLEKLLSNSQISIYGNSIVGFGCSDSEDECSSDVSKSGLTTHSTEEYMLWNYDEERFICAVCNRSFSTEVEIRQHVEAYLTKKLFSCELCNKLFFYKCYLANHNCFPRRKAVSWY